MLHCFGPWCSFFNLVEKYALLIYIYIYMGTSIRHKEIHVKTPGSRAQKDTAWDRRVGTHVSPNGGGLVGPSFSLGGLRSLEGLRIFRPKKQPYYVTSAPQCNDYHKIIKKTRQLQKRRFSHVCYVFLQFFKKWRAWETLIV